MRLVTRSAWGAAAPKCKTPLAKSAVRAVVYHYTASDADEQANHANCGRRVKGIQTFHQGPSRGWCDIAYNFVVCKHGYVYEGRGLGVKSAATGDANGHTVAVCFLGDDTANRDDVTDAGRRAMAAAARHIEAWVGRELAYKGHRDYMSTSCPGNEIYRYIHLSAFRNAVDGEQMLPGPSPKPAWFWLWADWKRTPKANRGPRPEEAPRLIPVWAWRALAEWNRRHPVR